MDLRQMAALGQCSMSDVSLTSLLAGSDWHPVCHGKCQVSLT